MGTNYLQFLQFLGCQWSRRPRRVTQRLCRPTQDPKFPVENLLREDEPRPWLGCPRDRSGRLRVELQLEQASPIGYVDIGTRVPFLSPGGADPWTGATSPQTS